MKIYLLSLLLCFSVMADDHGSLLFSPSEMQRLKALKQQSPKAQQAVVPPREVFYEAFMRSASGDRAVSINGRWCEAVCVIHGVKIQPALLQADGALLLSLGGRQIRLYPGQTLTISNGQVSPTLNAVSSFD